MKKGGFHILAGCLAAALHALAEPDPNRRLPEIIEANGSLADSAVRERVVSEARQAEEARKTAARERALLQGLPLRGRLPNGTVFELAEYEGGTPLYRRTCNLYAGISLGSDLIRVAPYFANGTGGTIGLWDASAARTTHQEFNGRVTIKDGSSATDDHSSHVAGTLCAAGVTLAARGMATNAWVDSYDWNNDTSEMTSRGASYPGESGKIYVSNHSYGFNTGWVYTGTPSFTWYGLGTSASAYEDDFGKYNTYARSVDALAFNLPYYQIFWAAGNERGLYESPSVGQSVALSPGGFTVMYNPSVHPPRDDTYRSGYDTISYCALSKNVVTVGAVNDATSGTTRYLPSATMATFSSWGPADDGRIKPDVVANGTSVYSCYATSDTAYGTSSGTSMATPSAAGLAQQLIHFYGLRYPGKFMRASTLKGVLIHTADDLGKAGPDYVFGWGLLNGKAAADLIADSATNTLTPRLIEQQLTTSIQTQIHRFDWDGVSPIRVTLSWTDPAGTAQAGHDVRTPNLVNNLNLRLLGPSGTQYNPYVMPFVGTWTLASMSAAAVTGTNNTDNVEQVAVATNGLSAGTYQAIISYTGTLANNQQAYSLLISGSAPPPPRPLNISPNTAVSGLTTVTITGESFATNAAVVFLHSGSSNLLATASSANATSIVCSVNASVMAAGTWDVCVVNPMNRTGTLSAAFTVLLPEVSSVSPACAEGGIVPFTITGQHFGPTSQAYFCQPPEPARGLPFTFMSATTLTGLLDVASMPKGPWSVYVINPDNKASNTNILFTVVTTLAAQSFDNAFANWQTIVTYGSGTSGWSLSSLAYHSATNAYRIAASADIKTDALVSEPFYIPKLATSLQLHFWHAYYLEATDGGVLDLSYDNGDTWHEIGTTNGGSVFAAGAYPSTITQKTGRTPAELVGMSAWNGTTSDVFAEVIVDLNPAVFAGKTLRARWRLSSDSKNGPETWYWSVDSLLITGYAPPSPATVILLR